jgi:hypothetical protein
MWRSGVIVLLALSVVAARVDRAVIKEKVTGYRVLSQNLHIEHLEKDVEKLEHEFDKLSAPLEKEDINRIRARVRRFEGNKCDKKEVSCGGDVPECVHNLFVCDGHKDCTNGNDEDEFICDMTPITPGGTFKGLVTWSGCVERRDHSILLTITNNYRSSFFGSRAFVRATITSEVDEYDAVTTVPSSIQTKGYFVFATRQLALINEPEAQHRLVTVCTFHFGTHDHADCKILQEGSLTQCARVRLEPFRTGSL